MYLFQPSSCLSSTCMNGSERRILNSQCHWVLHCEALRSSFNLSKSSSSGIGALWFEFILVEGNMNKPKSILQLLTWSSLQSLPFILGWHHPLCSQLLSQWHTCLAATTTFLHSLMELPYHSSFICPSWDHTLPLLTMCPFPCPGLHFSLVSPTIWMFIDLKAPQRTLI